MLSVRESLLGLRVLVVEDEALIAEELHLRLSRLGMTVVASVDSADGAVARAADTQPDIVLMDIRLRGARDGIEAALEIRRSFDVPVVFLTAHSDIGTLHRAKQAAPFGYVLKPFEEQELIIAIELAVHRHALERQLRESERRYVATLASIGDAVIATDPAGRIAYMNPVAEALTGWVFADARGLPAADVFRVVTEASGGSSIQPLDQASAEQRTITFETAGLFLVSRGSEAIPVDANAAPIRDDQGRITGAVVAFRDIRDRRLAEDALRRAEEELAQSARMESLGRLAGGVAHDFNNLLTVINGCSDLALVNTGLDPTTRDLLQEIKKAGGRAAEVTRQFVSFARQQPLHPRVVDLNVLIGDAEPIVARLMTEHVALATNLSSRALHILVDPAQVERVVVNLAVNARDAMPTEGTLTIETSLALVDGGTSEAIPGAYALLTVRDTGAGMDDAVIRQAFEPYFTTKAVGKGSGLGLATVYGIVKQSGGFVTVDSAPSHGTTFSVYWPCVDEAAPVDAGGAFPADVRRRTEEILVVDDEDGVRALISAILIRQGYRVIEAANGQDALDVFQRSPGSIDLVVTDVMMPGMLGTTLATRLGALKPGVRILFVSGYSREKVVLGPEAEFLQKPFTPATLVRNVRELLDRAPRR